MDVFLEIPDKFFRQLCILTGRTELTLDEAAEIMDKLAAALKSRARRGNEEDDNKS